MSEVASVSGTTASMTSLKMNESINNFEKNVANGKFDRLNDDCLAHLFALLAIDDLYAAVCAVPHLERVLLLFNSKFEYSVTDLGREDLPDFLRLVGRHIKTLNVAVSENCDNNAVLGFFGDVDAHCVHLKHLSVRSWRHMNLAKFERMLGRLSFLRLDECKYQERCDSPSQRFCIKPWSIVPSVFPALSPTGKSSLFPSLLSLTSLRLHNCASIRPEHLVDFLKSNERLVHLSLFNMHEFKSSSYDGAYFDEMGKHLRAVEALSVDMDTTVHINFLADLPRLRSLQLINFSAPDKHIVDRVIRRLRERDAIEELDLYHCHLDTNTFRTISSFSKLIALRMSKNFWVTDQNLMLLAAMPKLQNFCCFDCILLTGEGLMHVMRMSPKLEQLDCSWCFQVTDQMVRDIAVVLAQHSNRPKLRIIAGGRTKLSASILASELLTKNVHRLSVRFEPTMPISCALDDKFCCNCKSKPDRLR